MGKEMETKTDHTAGIENGKPPVVRIGRELKYQGTILKIYEDRVISNGHECRWDFIHHDGAAAVIPVTEEGKILMVRQYRNALDRFTLEIPAGKLDSPDEPTLDCAARELEEETGYRAESMEFSVYKGKNDDGYTGRSISGLEEKLEIEPGTEQGVAALFFDDYEMRHLPVSAIEEENGGAENDCVYYFSVEFTE